MGDCTICREMGVIFSSSAATEGSGGCDRATKRTEHVDSRDLLYAVIVGRKAVVEDARRSG